MKLYCEHCQYGMHTLPGSASLLCECEDQRCGCWLLLHAEPEDDSIKLYGHGATETEKNAGQRVHDARKGRLKPGKWGHLALRAHASGHGRWTAYEVSVMLCGDPHGKRRESRRLYDRGLLLKDGTKSNVHITVDGRPHVDAFILTDAGWAELHRLEPKAA